MSQTLERQIVERARALIATKKTWTRHAVARDKNDQLTGWGYPNAVRWCAEGALLRATHDLTGDVERTGDLAMQTAFRITAGRDRLSNINDSRGHKKVLKLFDTYLEKMKV